MKILAFVVKIECPSNCDKGRVPGGQREYGELIDCPTCKGKGSIMGESSYEAFEKLIRGVIALSTKGR